MSEKIVQLNEEVIKGQIKELVRVVSRIFRKMVCRLWHERSQPAMEVSSTAASGQSQILCNRQKRCK